MKYKVLDISYMDIVNNIHTYFKNSKISIHKARNEIKKTNFENNVIIIKSFKVPHIINRIAYTFFRDSKAKKSYNNSIRLLGFVPRPIAYIEFFRAGLLSQSYFISEAFEYDFTIREVLTDLAFPNRDKIYKAFAKFAYKLHNEGIEHLDFSPGNILIKQIDNDYIFQIIDVNRMRFRKLSIVDRLKNFAKLWARDEDMQIIIQEYAKLININENDATVVAIKFSQKHKNKKNFKKRLKGKKVVD